MAGAEIGALLAKLLVPLLIAAGVAWLILKIRRGAVTEHQVKEVGVAKKQRAKNVTELKEARRRMRNAGLRGWLSKRRRLEPPPSE